MGPFSKLPQLNLRHSSFTFEFIQTIQHEKGERIENQRGVHHVLHTSTLNLLHIQSYHCRESHACNNAISLGTKDIQPHAHKVSACYMENIIECMSNSQYYNNVMKLEGSILSQKILLDACRISSTIILSMRLSSRFCF